jgi:hypothetical protein
MRPLAGRTFIFETVHPPASRSWRVIEPEILQAGRTIMAKVKLNPSIECIQGAIGDLVYKRWGDGEIVGRMPDRTGIVPTENQVAQMERFKLAAIYGKAVMSDPDSRQVYEDAASQKGKPVFALTVADFLLAPVVDEIDLSTYGGKTGDKIRIRASDDIEVKGVTVEIRAQAGAVLEQGAAVFTPSLGAWVYTATTDLAQGQAVSIDVSATDRPGHKGTKTQARN